jgi:hypothetical protein
MKRNIFSVFIAIACMSVANAATTIQGFNYSLTAPAFAQQVVASPAVHTPFVGTVMYGTFTTTTGLGSASNGTVNLATYGWTMFASTPFNVSANQPGLFGATFASGTLPNVGSAAGAFVGKNIFAVVANAANNDYVIWDSGKLFAYEVAGVGGAAVSFGTNAVTTTLVRGQVVVGGNNGLAGAISAQNGKDAITFGAAVPEPSAALLGALGALGLLRRRRI